MCIQNEAPIRTETNTQYLLLLKFSVQTSARRRTRSGGPRPARTGAERRHRTFEPRIGLENKKERCFMHHSFLFISARRGSNYTIVRKPSKYKEESTLPNRWVQTGCNHILIILIPTHYIALFIFFVL